MSDKVSIIHRHLDVYSNGYINFEELQCLQLITSGSELTPDQYEMACQSLGCHTRDGIPIDALKLTYASEGQIWVSYGRRKIEILRDREKPTTTLPIPPPQPPPPPPPPRVHVCKGRGGKEVKILLGFFHVNKHKYCWYEWCFFFFFPFFSMQPSLYARYNSPTCAHQQLTHTTYPFVWRGFSNPPPHLRNRWSIAGGGKWVVIYIPLPPPAWATNPQTRKWWGVGCRSSGRVFWRFDH